MKLLLCLAVIGFGAFVTNSQETIERDPEVLNDVLAKYNSAFGKDLEDVPPHMLREALKLALPRMQEQLVDYSMNMYASGKAARGSKPNALLVGFSMGLKTWSEYLSKFIPLLNQAVSGRFHELKNDLRCLYRNDVCYEDGAETELHPCCYFDVSCPLSLL